MRVICTTSDRYHHLLLVFFYCFNKYFPGQEVILLGYATPSCTLPDNVTFHSMGEQGPVEEWSTDIRNYLQGIPDEWIMWLMEDSLLRASVREGGIADCYALMLLPNIGRIALTKDILNRPYRVLPGSIVYAEPKALYRLSTQPAIWNKEWLLKWLKPGLTPWAMERQDAHDEFNIVGFKEPVMCHNEGCRRTDIYKLDLNGFSTEDIDHIKNIAPWLK